MGKSQYPAKLDTSVELPTAIDIPAADLLNSLRSSIFQIEKTLGINPQGNIGNTVASRIGNSLDNNGNILASALNKAGLITGPVTNKDVSESAGIEERKLKLDFPTGLLQNELSILDSQISGLIDQIDILSTNFSSHISKDALNRHSALSISLVPKTSIPSSNATINIESSNVLDLVDDIYDSHINFNPLDISPSNRSHNANQIYFDNTNNLLNSNNVQDAITESYELREGLTIEHQNLQHSNGILAIGDINSFENKFLSEVIYDNISVTFSKSNGNIDNSTLILLNDPVNASDVNIGDFIFLNDDNNLYQIKKISQSFGIVNSITIFGLLNFSSIATSSIQIGKSNKIDYNKSSLLTTVIEDANLTSARSLFLLSPNMIRVISKNINPDGITNLNKLISINDGYKIHQVNVFDNSIPRQTLDSIIKKINKYSIENNGLFFAYRLDAENSSELVIAHNIEDTESSKQTLIIDRIDSAIDDLGLSNYEGLEVKTSVNTKYYINGNKYFALKEKINTFGLIFFKASNIIDRGTLNINFLDLGIKAGDIINILDSDNSGSYLISSVSETQITINSSQLTTGFAENSVPETRFIIYNNCMSVDSITFDIVSASLGSTLLDVFIDNNQNMHYSKILEYSNSLVGTNNLFEIVDIRGDANISQSLLEIKLDPNDPNGILLSLDGGENISVIGDNQYTYITSGAGNFAVRILISSITAVITKINNDLANIISNIYYFNSQNFDYLFKLSRVLYNNFKGRLAGGINGSRVFDKKIIGNIGPKQISNIAKEELILNPRSELRYNGVIYGLEIFNQQLDINGLYQFSLNRGVCYINGKRIEKDTVSNISTQISASSNDKIFVIISEDGVITFNTSIGSNCTSPFGSTDFCIIGSIEFDGSSVIYHDLRLFIDHLDLKLLNSICVSQQPGMGHFTDIRSAIQYAKRFYEIFPLAGIPTVHVKSGEYKLNITYNYNYNSGAFNPSDPSTQEDFYNKQIREGIFIDFPMILEGEGPGTILELTSTLIFLDTTHIISMPVIVPGPGLTAPSFGFDNISNNDFIYIKNMLLKNTRISLVDFIVETGANEQRYIVSIDNVIFDYYNFTPTFIDTTRRAIELLEVNNTSDNKGNVNINNCTFIKSGIFSSSAARTKNINITGNTYFDDDGTTNFLLTDLLSFSSAGTGSNINISNNRTSSSFSSLSNNIVAGQTYNWSERFSRDVRIGNDLYVTGNYTHDSVKSLVTMYYADDLLDSAVWSGSSPWSGATNFTYGINPIAFSGVTVNYPYIILTAANTQGRVKIKPAKNGVLNQVTTFYNGGTSSATVTITLLRLDPNAGFSGFPQITSIASASFTIPLISPAERIGSATVTFNAPITSNFHYLLQYQLSGGANIEIYGLSTNIDVLTVESYLGVE